MKHKIYIEKLEPQIKYYFVLLLSAMFYRSPLKFCGEVNKRYVIY
jgi:hypothetical protein